MVSKLIKMPKYGILFKKKETIDMRKDSRYFKARSREPLAYYARGFSLYQDEIFLVQKQEAFRTMQRYMPRILRMPT